TPALRQQVEGLLRAHADAGSFLQTPAPGLPSTIDQPSGDVLGTVIGPYRLLQQIGEGGRGTGDLWSFRGLQGPDRASGGSFSSRHVGGVQFCFVDGHVRLLRRGDTFWDVPTQDAPPPPKPDWVVLQNLAGYQDGGSVRPNLLFD